MMAHSVRPGAADGAAQTASCEGPKGGLTSALESMHGARRNLPTGKGTRQLLPTKPPVHHISILNNLLSLAVDTSFFTPERRAMGREPHPGITYPHHPNTTRARAHTYTEPSCHHDHSQPSGTANATDNQDCGRQTMPHRQRLTNRQRASPELPRRSGLALLRRRRV